MKPERLDQLQRDPNAVLTAKEMKEGWVFCCEWDGLLIHKNDPEADCCSCLNQKEQTNVSQKGHLAASAKKL